jgi:predicted DsbA family dithiol-disulfide isomerase
MSRRTALGAAILVAPALCLSGCGGSGSPPAAPDGNTLAYDAPFPDAGQAKPNDGVSVELLPDDPGLPAVTHATRVPEELPFTQLPPERVPRPGLDLPSRGPADAKVTLQIFSDFECPFCAKTAPVIEALASEFGPRLRIVFRNYPLPAHPHARLAAAAALEVYVERGGAAFFRMHDALFARAPHGLDGGVLERLASAEKVDPTRFRQALTSGVHDARIEADIAAGDLAGIEGTPAFLVNDWYGFGALPYVVLRAAIVRALSEPAAPPGR